MPQYLNAFSGVLKNIQTRQILKLLNQKKSTGEIRNLDEFSEQIEELVRDLTAETMKPSLELFYADEELLISADSFNFMLDRVQDDLEASFAEALRVHEVQQAHEVIIKDVILKNLKAGVSELDTKISMYEFMNSNNHGFSHGLFSTFRESQENRTNRSSTDQNRTLFIDPRTESLISIEQDAVVDAVGERLILSNRDQDQDYWSISSARLLFDSETPIGDMNVSPPSNTVNKIIDNRKGTFWVQSFQFRKKQDFVIAKVEVDLGIIQEVNFLEIEPANEKGIVLQSVHYLDANNVVQDLGLPERTLEGPVSISIQTISTDRLVFTFRTENSKRISFVADAKMAGVGKQEPGESAPASSLDGIAEKSNGTETGGKKDTGTEIVVGDPVIPDEDILTALEGTEPIQHSATMQDVWLAIEELRNRHDDTAYFLENLYSSEGLVGPDTDIPHAVISAPTSTFMQSVATENNIGFFNKPLTLSERVLNNLEADGIFEQVGHAVHSAVNVGQSHNNVALENAVTQSVTTPTFSNTAEVTVNSIMDAGYQAYSSGTPEFSAGVTNQGNMHGVAAVHTSSPNVQSSSLINGSASIYPSVTPSSVIIDGSLSGEIQSPTQLQVFNSSAASSYNLVSTSHSSSVSSSLASTYAGMTISSSFLGVPSVNMPSSHGGINSPSYSHRNPQQSTIEDVPTSTVVPPVGAWQPPPAFDRFRTAEIVFSGYEYKIGLDNIRVGRTKYSHKSIYVSQPLALSGAGLLGLKVLESRPYNEPGQSTVAYTSDTYDISTIDSDSFFHGSIEYWVVRQEFGENNKLVKTTRFPVLPTGVDRVYHERLVLNDKSTTNRLTNDVGTLSFFALRSESDIKIYRNGSLISDVTDEASQTDGWVRDTDLPSNDVPNNVYPMRFRIRIINPLPGEIFTVSYTPILSTTNTIPNTLTQFTSSSGLQITDLVGDLSAFVSEEQIVNLQRIEDDESLETKLFLVVILRLNTADVTLTPSVEEYTLFASCRDSSKFEEI